MSTFLDRDERARSIRAGGRVTRRELQAVAEALASETPGVEAVYLFGSRARQDHRDGSDVDLAVLLADRVPSAYRHEVQSDLVRFFEDRLPVPVDVVLVEPDLPPGLLFDSFRIETLLYARDREHAHEVACRYRAEYRDLLPRLDRQFDAHVSGSGGIPKLSAGKWRKLEL